MADPVYLNEPQRASDYVHQICILMGIVVPDPDYCADEENRLTYLIALLLDNWGGGGGGTFWAVDGNNNASTKSIGTTSNQDYNFISNNIARGTAFKTGEFMWGSTAGPLARFHVVGSGITSGSINFYTQNSDNSHSLSHYDNGVIYRDGSPYSIAHYSISASTSWGLQSGFQSGSNNVYNVLIGANAGYGITNTAGEYNQNVIVGTFSGPAAATTRTDQSVLVGENAGVTLLGNHSSILGTRNVFMGCSTGNGCTYGYNNTFIGTFANNAIPVVTAFNTICIGAWSNTGNFSSVLGFGCSPATADRQIIFGGTFDASTASSVYYTDMYVGNGITNATIPDFKIRATSATGANISASTKELSLIPQLGTGSAAGGSIKLYYSPAGSTGSVLNTPTVGYTLDNTGLSTVVNLKITALAASGSEIITIGNDGTVGKTSFTAKGDLAVYDGTNVTVLAAGTNDTLLAYDSATATGFKTVATGTTAGTLCTGNDSRLPRIIVHAGDQALVATVAITASAAPSGASSLRYRWNRCDDIMVCHFRLEYASAGTAVTNFTINWPSDMPNPGSITGWDNSEFGISVTANVFTVFNNDNGIKATTAAIKKDGGGAYQIVVQPGASQNASGCQVTVVINTDPS